VIDARIAREVAYCASRLSSVSRLLKKIERELTSRELSDKMAVDENRCSVRKRHETPDSESGAEPNQLILWEDVFDDLYADRSGKGLGREEERSG